MSNPAMNPNIYQRETAANQPPGAFEPGWGSPADELPPNVFDQSGAAAAGAAGTMRPPAPPTSGGDTMRMGGTMTATAILLGILMVAGWFGWQAVTVTQTGISPSGTKTYDISIPPWLFLSWIVGFGIAVLTIFKPKLARITGPLYAIAEGLLLGGISKAYDAQWDGIVVQAVLLTFGVFVMMLVLYATGTIKVTNKLRTGIIAATGAVCLVYLASIVVSLFGGNMPVINDASPIGIGFSVLVVGIAAFNLLLDFDFIQKAVDYRAPRYMEWFGAFALMITLVWLYLEILRLLAKLRSN